MKELKNVEEKEAVAASIKALIDQLNKEVGRASLLNMSVVVYQNPPRGKSNSHVRASITETIAY